MAARASIILAAGQGTRMKSNLPKVMHEVGGRPMIDWAIELAKSAGCERIVVVLSPMQTELHARIRARLGDGSVAIQSEPLGTGHAALAAKDALQGFEGSAIVQFGDTPLIPPEPVEALFKAVEARPAIGVLGFEAAHAGAYGRLIETEDGQLSAIVEAKDATPEQRSVTLCNSGVMAARASDMFRLLAQVRNDNAKGEYYLTDLVALGAVEGVPSTVVRCNEADTLGVNSRAQLAEAEASFQSRMRQAALDRGVTLTCPETVFFNYDTQVETDVVIEPNVVFGAGVEVRSGARIRAFSHLEGAIVSSGCEVGPYARLRPGTVLEERAKIGNFVEVKKTTVGAGAKANHLAYLGDGEIGASANIGAGTIFCNYDGFFKHKTIIGAGAFVGSNSALIAPVSIGNGAYIGSGSVITKDVDADALSVARSRQIEKSGWGHAFREKMSARKAETKT